MSMTDEERTELGERIRARRERAFGTKRAAYSAATVNAATWDKAEAGDSVRPDLLRNIVRTLWVETEGDWSLVLAGFPDLQSVMDKTSSGGASSGLHLVSDQDLIGELSERLRQRETRLAELGVPAGVKRGGRQLRASEQAPTD